MTNIPLITAAAWLVQYRQWNETEQERDKVRNHLRASELGRELGRMEELIRILPADLPIPTWFDEAAKQQKVSRDTYLVANLLVNTALWERATT